MSWLPMLGYFAAALVMLVIALEVFALLLRSIASLPAPFPLLIGLLLYLGLVMVFAVPLFGLDLLWPAQAQDEREIALCGYLVCLGLAVLVFRQRHLLSQQALGYYRPRNPRR